MTKNDKPDLRSAQCDGAICRWLESPEGQKILDAVARSAHRFVEGRKVAGGFSDPAMETSAEDIRSALVEFLLNSEKLRAILSDPDQTNGGSVLKTAFLNHLKDRSVRGPAGSPWHYLRKRTLGVLGGSKDFRVEKRQKALLFGTNEKAATIPLLTGDELREIPFPVHEISLLYKDATREKSILFLLRWFLEKISAQWGGRPVLAEVNDFVTWVLGCVSPISRPDENETGSREDPAGLPWRDDPFDPDSICRWAEAFGNRLTEQEAAVFYLRECCGKKLKIVADFVGRKSATTVINRLEAVEDKMESYLRELRWLSPDDLNEQAWSLFFEILCEKLEKSVSKPLTQSENKRDSKE